MKEKGEIPVGRGMLVVIDRYSRGKEGDGGVDYLHEVKSRQMYRSLQAIHVLVFRSRFAS